MLEKIKSIKNLKGIESIKAIRQYAITIITIVAILVINVCAYVHYSGNIKNQLTEQTETHIKTLMEETVECVNVKMDERLETYRTLANFIGTLHNVIDEDTLGEILEQQGEQAGYLEFDIIDMNGRGLEYKGSNEYGEKVEFEKACDGKSVVSVREDAKGNVEGIVYYTPVYYGDDVVRIFQTYVSIEQFATQVDVSQMGQGGNVFLIEQDGTLLSRNKGLDDVESMEFIINDEKTTQKLVNSIQSRKSGYITYGEEESKRYLCYARTDYNKWYTVSIYSASNIEVSSDDITNEGTIFFAEIVVLTCVLLAYLVRMIYKESTNKQINMQRYHIVSKYSDSIVFDYSCEKDTMYCNGKWKDIFGYDVERSNLKEDITRHIHQQDKEKYKKMVESLRDGKEVVKFHAAFLDVNNNPKRCMIRLFAIRSKRSKIQKVLGVIESFTENI